MNTYIINIFNDSELLYHYLDDNIISKAPYIFTSKRKAQQFFNTITEDINIETDWYVESFTKTDTKAEYWYSAQDDYSEHFKIELVEREITK